MAAVVPCCQQAALLDAVVAALTAPPQQKQPASVARKNNEVLCICFDPGFAVQSCHKYVVPHIVAFATHPLSRKRSFWQRAQPEPSVGRRAYPVADVAVEGRIMIRGSMRSFVALVAIAPFLMGASTPSSQRLWRIVRHDYVEFCAGTTLTWDLHRGTLKTAKGACDPYRNSPPTITIAKLPVADLKQLRRLSEEALNQGIATQPCNNVPGHVLPGPLDFTIELGGRKVHSPPCINDLGRLLEAVMVASTHR